MWNENVGTCPVPPDTEITLVSVAGETMQCKAGDVSWSLDGPPEGVVQQWKPTNPKDALGSTKLPTSLVPSSLLVLATQAFAEGASKYGSYNWRAAGVRASIYKAAHDRHMERYWNGEDADPVTGVPHLASAVACLAIINDAATRKVVALKSCESGAWRK